MKSFTIALTLFSVIALTNTSLAIGFPHNLLSRKKVEKKEIKTKNIASVLQKKAILANESRLLNIGSKIFLLVFKRQEE
jgi:hypothetical protein